jgi:hypothetical protein
LATAVKVCEPGASVTAQLHEPPAVAVVVQSVVPVDEVSTTWAFGVAVPLTVAVVATVVFVAGLRIATEGGQATVVAVTGEVGL